ncbi:MAG: hypothetical protein L6R36_008062 [Xanthoria steineri]|nr:MAG: hypothetical protein L6R36_008062 [Xanthoria steineri]
MTNVIQPRASTIHELPSMHDMARYPPATTTMKPAHGPASPDPRHASVAELLYQGLPMSDVSSTARLIERNPTPA